MTPGSFLDISIGVLYALVVALFSMFVIFRIKEPPCDRKILFAGIVAHLFSAIGFVIFMKAYYGYLGDALYYFNTSAFIFNNLLDKFYNSYELLFASPETLSVITQLQLFGTFDPEVIYMARFTLPFYVLGMGLFTPTSVLISTLPFIGKFLLLKAIQRSTPDTDIRILNKVALTILFIPTVLFWGTTILKESFLMFAIGLLFISLQMLWSRKVFMPLLLIPVALHIIMNLKGWVMFVFGIASLASITLYILNLPKIRSDIVLRIGTFVIFTILFGFIFYFGIQHVIQEVIDNFLKIAYGFQTWHTYLGHTRGQSSYTLLTIPNLLEARWWQFIIAFPEALLTALYRPFIFEIDRLSEALVLPENLFILILTTRIFLRFKNVWQQMANNPILLTAFIFGILTLYVVGLVSFNFGAMVRYRIPGLLSVLTSLSLAYFIMKRQGQDTKG